MIDDEFNPNDDLDSKEQADRYVQWCAHQLGLHQAQQARTLGTAQRAASFLWVIAAAQLHLDDDIDWERESHDRNIIALFSTARRIERRPSTELKMRPLQVGLMLTDAWEPVGCYADRLLCTLRCAIGALVIAEAHPLADKLDLPAQHCWALIDAGISMLEEIGTADWPDYAVAPSRAIADRMGWQRAGDVAKRFGAPPPSAN